MAPLSMNLSTALAAGHRSLIHSGRFVDGVMSGDPTPDGVTLWGRLAQAHGRGTVALEVAEDPGFRRVVAHDRVAVTPEHGYTLKARVGGLEPHRQYHYRFHTRDVESRAGQFKTAPPPDSAEPVRFAFFSCQDYGHGYFNAHRLMAEEDIDFVVCLGDYIYAESAPGLYNQNPLLSGIQVVRHDTVGTADTLDEYRRKYSLYRSDPALQDLHAKVPLVTIWDDHEVSDDYFGGRPQTKAYPPAHHDIARRRAAYQAFFEAMPLFPVGGSGTRIYRALRYGGVVDLVLCDERQYRAEQPCGDAVAVPECPGIGAPRRFLGAGQQQFVQQRLRASDATWKLVANEVMIMPARLTSELVYGFDSWGGYQQEREELLGFIRANNIENVAFLTGDIHLFLAGEVRTADGATVANEFVGGSITSPGLGEFTIKLRDGTVIRGNDAAPNTPPAIVDTLLAANPWVRGADLDHHGYAVVEARRDQLTVSYRRLQTIKHKSLATLPSLTWTLQPGQTGLGTPELT